MPPADAGTPAPIEAEISPQRWSAQQQRTNWSLAAGGMRSHLPRILQGAGALVMLLLCWQLGSALRAQFDIWNAERAAANLDAPFQRILSARETADRNAAATRQLLALRTGVPQHQLMAEVSRLMAGKQWQIKVWQQPVPERLEVTHAMAPPDPEF